MPNAYKCSRCGNLYEGEPFESWEMESLDEKVEMCKACVEELIPWFDGHESTRLDDFEEGGE